MTSPGDLLVSDLVALIIRRGQSDRSPRRSAWSGLAQGAVWGSRSGSIDVEPLACLLPEPAVFLLLASATRRGAAVVGDESDRSEVVVLPSAAGPQDLEPVPLQIGVDLEARRT